MMIDTVNLEISQADVEGGVDFLSEVPPHLNPDTISLHNYRGDVAISGWLDNLQVEVRGWRVRVGRGSLCKYAFGDNFQTMGRADIKRAVERISDSLYLPMERAVVRRLDVAENLCVRQPPQVYFNHLGMMACYDRLKQPDGLYYKNKRGKVLCFYDKIKEQRDKREPIPELYESSNVLRYEQRYMGRIGGAFEMADVRACNLYEERFYIELLNRWRDDYRAISKINELIPNFKCMKNVRDFNLLGRLAYIERMGGEIAMLEAIAEAQRTGDLTAKQAYDLREAVKGSCMVREDFTARSEVIVELDKKIAEAVRFYR